MNIVIRTDASVHIGSGHVMRCLVLAKALKQEGHDVCFITRAQLGDMIDFISQQNFRVQILELPSTPLVPKNSADYSAWLQVSELDDANHTIALIDNVDLMIVDHYGINILWEQQVKTQLQCQMMAVDDLVRPHHADMILDQTFSRKASDYISSVKRISIANVLTGCQFALLAPRFAELREQAFCKRLNISTPKILISMGGIDNVDLMIVDHYGINTLWEQQVKTQLQCQMMAVDDLVRPHHADMILDQTFSRKASDYISSVKRISIANVLTGCQFALLAPRFAELREQAFCKRLNISTPKILISMGGIDNPNASLQVLQCLERLPLKPAVTVLLSVRSPHYEKVRVFCQSRGEWINHIEFTHSMPELMLEHDLSIGAPGSTSWERACLGLPSVVIPLAENQQQICAVLESAGAVLRVEMDRINDTLLPAYHHILANWLEFQQVNLSLCDGLGSQRVVQRIEQLFQ